jgi:glyoxylase-like metal-dependent hydrolase (beta-lactamase superfamily II)
VVATGTALSRVYPYRPLKSLAANLWQVAGTLANGLPRNMTVYRLPDGRLLLYSVVAMHEDGMGALEGLGRPAIMVMPHDRHSMDAPFYKRRYPDLRVLAPEPHSVRVVPVDGDIAELVALGIAAYSLPGTTYHEVVLELPIEGGVALCGTELLTSIVSLPGLKGVLLRGLGPPGGGFGVARVVKWREVSDRQSVRAWLTSLAERPEVRMVLVGHGGPVMREARSALRHAAAQV